MSFPLVSETHRVIYTTVKAQTPHFLPLFLIHIPGLTSPTSYVFDIERSTFLFAAVTHTPPSVSKNDRRKWTFFMFYTIVYIKNINEMQCNIYYVYIIPSDVITITTSCFIVATTFSPLPSSPMSLHPTVSFFLHLLWWFLFLLHQLRHQLFCKSYFLIRLLILLLNYSIGFTSCHSVPVCYV